jgi:2-keto-4-pentenoate hydratase/2-oxohepta-3-ene-1,7-dioic acid hydratase in catechol pathway
MKVVRFISPEGQEQMGAYLGGDEADVVEGPPAGPYRLTGRKERMAKWLSPIVPVNILAVGLNYRCHAEETGMSYPDLPILFLKATSSVVAHGEAIELPLAGPEQVDYEAELALVINRTARNVSRKEALDYVGGYTCANDVSARDWQLEKQKKQWSRGKSFDTFCPLGPWLVTPDELPDPGGLAIRAILNGQVMQDSNTDRMIFDIPALVADLSRSLTLLPGTVILTGTPSGVGFTRKPPVFLRENDEIAIEIEGVGRLINRVVRGK